MRSVRRPATLFVSGAAFGCLAIAWLGCSFQPPELAGPDVGVCSDGRLEVREVVIDNAELVASIEGFPVLLALDSTSIDYALTRDDGSDLCFEQLATGVVVPHEIERWDESGVSRVWVQVPVIEARDGPAARLAMYYGGAGAAATAVAKANPALWRDSYVSVHHFTDRVTDGVTDGIADGDVLADVSGRGHDGVSPGVDQQPSPTDGRIAGGVLFDGQDDQIELPVEGDFDFSDSMSVSTWFRVDRFSKAWQAIVTKGDDAWRVQRLAETGQLTFDVDWEQGGETVCTGTQPIDDRMWHHLGVTFDGVETRLYVDGQLDCTQTFDRRALRDTDHAVLIGNNSQTGGRNFEGAIDEVRISSRNRSEAWMYAEYATVAVEGFVKVGDPQPAN